MGEMFLDDLKEYILSVRSEVEKKILIENQYKGRSIRRKPRDEEEKRILTIIAKSKWERAEREGKVIYFSPTEWYYEL